MPYELQIKEAEVDDLRHMIEDTPINKSLLDRLADAEAVAEWQDDAEFQLFRIIETDCQGAMQEAVDDIERVKAKLEAGISIPAEEIKNTLSAIMAELNAANSDVDIKLKAYDAERKS